MSDEEKKDVNSPYWRGFQDGGKAMLKDSPERTKEIEAMDRMIEMDTKMDIRAITIQGDLYWMPKAEANQLIDDFLNDLSDNYIYWNNATKYNELRNKWQNLKNK